MSMNFADLILTSVETISAYDILTGAHLYTMDELQNASIAQAQDKTDITGKMGRKLASLKKNKAIAISATNGVISAGLMESQTGCKFENKVTKVRWTDYLKVTSNAATTTYKAVGTTGNEIEYVDVKNSDGVVVKTLTQDSAASEGKFTYDPATKALAFKSGDIADNTEIVVHYDRNIQADVLTNISDCYSKKVTMYIDCFAEDKCGVVYRVQFYVPKADVSGEFTLEFGDNQAVHAFEAESLAGACGAGDILYTYTVYGADAEDAA